jgi:hypothetical protein
MNLLKRVVRLMTSAVLLTAAASAQQGEGPINPVQPKGMAPEQIVQKVAENEAAFKKAWERYTYRQDIKVQTRDGNTVDGEYRLVQDVLFDDQGRRIEKVLFAPQNTLQRISMSPEDHHDLRNLMGFVFTPEELPEYNVLYVGQQRVDELDTYIFDVAPKKIEKGKRYFQGRIWVDQQDLQAVKTKGRAVPDIRGKNNENLFPEFTSYREQVDKKYWFPTYVRADDTLKFSAQEVDIRIIVKYENYKQFGSDVKIVYEGEEVQRTPEAKEQEQPK